MNKIVSILILFVSVIKVNAQIDELGSWNILNIKLNLNDKYAVFIEPQLRSLLLYNNFHYHEFKGGVIYNINKHFHVSIGTGNYVTYREGGSFVEPVLTDEMRTWMQFGSKQYLGVFTIDHRYRAEQRFIGNNYRNRFRYRLNTVLPLKGNKVVPGVFYASVFNEIFLTDVPPYFERNRFYTGIGYDISNTLSIQTGYVYQFDYRLFDEIGRNFFQLGILVTLQQSKDKLRFFPLISN
ncbi:MAG: DUF2490 domain-containing protein [Bacteroidia bacterium]